MKLDQIAYYAHNEYQWSSIADQFGICIARNDWVHDKVVGDLTLFNEDGSVKHDGQSTADLSFNYDMGIEFEILTYLKGRHWHDEKPEFRDGVPFISHIGFHMDPGEVVPKLILEKGQLVQHMQTISHLNPYLIEKKRRYVYEIYAMPFGPDQKFIWRIEE